MNVTISRTRLELREGDIAEQDTEAVVTAAHWDLAGGQGTDGAIHAKAGPSLLEECRRIGGCPIGGAVITGGYALKARYVVHAVGPVWEKGQHDEARWLAETYANALRLADDHGVRSISFPSLSTGAFGYPMGLAAPIAMEAIVDYLSMTPTKLDLVRMVLYPRESREAYGIYERALVAELGRRGSHEDHP